MLIAGKNKYLLSKIGEKEYYNRDLTKNFKSKELDNGTISYKEKMSHQWYAQKTFTPLS